MLCGLALKARPAVSQRVKTAISRRFGHRGEYSLHRWDGEGRFWVSGIGCTFRE